MSRLIRMQLASGNKLEVVGQTVVTGKYKQQATADYVFSSRPDDVAAVDLLKRFCNATYTSFNVPRVTNSLILRFPKRFRRFPQEDFNSLCFAVLTHDKWRQSLHI